ASSALGQTEDLSDQMGKTAFTAEDEAHIAKVVKPLLDSLVAGTDNRQVKGARSQLIGLTTNTRATVEFRTVAARIIVVQLQKRLKAPVLVHKNRLAAAIVVSRMQNPESVPLLLKLLVGEGPQGERYASVRYWAAKGLAGKKVHEAILRNNPLPLRKVLEALDRAITRETDAICVGAMLKVAAVLKTDQAVDLLIKATAAKARSLDLGNSDAVDTMKQAVVALEDAYRRDIRKMAEAKQPIIAALAQVLAQTPPHGSGLELITVVDGVLARLTSQTTPLGEKVRELQGQGVRIQPKTVDLVWVEQLNWIESLLKPGKPENKDLRLKQRPVYLDWSPAKSAEVARKAGRKK
ncbi:MAG: hypothetical protein GWP05_07665, partial [Anaerolineaceae bacterium]|nr:hypothetical protein [Anaerolineaceae bacterium]